MLNTTDESICLCLGMFSSANEMKSHLQWKREIKLADISLNHFLSSLEDSIARAPSTMAIGL